MSDACEGCGASCIEWYLKQLQLMEKYDLPPMHCFIVCLVQSVKAIKKNQGYANALALAEQLEALLGMALKYALEEEKEVKLDG
jgi:hypothetical protein